MIKHLLLITALLSLLSACDTQNAASKSPDDVLFEAFLEEEWQAFLKENPVAASGQGDRRYNAQLRDASAEGYIRRHASDKVFATRLAKIDRTALSPANTLNYDLMGFVLQHRIALAPFRGYRVPLLSDYGFHIEATFIPRTHPFATEADYEAYILRLEAIPAFFNDNITNMRQGMKDGFTMPQEIMPGVLSIIEGQQWKNAAETPFWRPLRSRPAFLDGTTWQTIRTKAEAALIDKVLPAYRDFYRFMADDYAPATRDTIGAHDLPNGASYYDALIHYYTNLDMTADQVHQLGLKEVARIRADMDQIIEQVNFQGSFADFIEFLRTDQQFYPASSRDLLMTASYYAKKADGKLPAYFTKLPRQPYRVAPVPAELAPNYTAGRYSEAPLASLRPGEYWVNTYALQTRPLYTIPALTLHESVPGHHLQTALALEMENVPPFRLNFYPHAFGEGWGLYTEKLGVEMDFYETPYEDFGRLTYEMWRACRLVVDTGMHAKGWSRQKAFDYLADNTALSLQEVKTEIDRYIAWPGQALAYKMGELKIWELRHKAETALGAEFDIRHFHDAVVSQGGIPLPLLEGLIDSYIADAKRQP